MTRVVRKRTTFVLALVASASAVTAAASCGIDLVGEQPARDNGTDAAKDGSPSVPDGDIPDAGGDNDIVLPSPCPTTGGAMVEVAFDAGAFCIDRTEVTNAAYDLFLKATDGGVVDGSFSDGGELQCAAYAFSFQRKTGATPGADNPADAVTWCDAFAFCRWAGKRLCGRLAPDRDATTGEWYMACSAGGARVYPYGNVADTTACTVSPSAGTKPVGSSPGCEGGVPTLVDMSGNAGEWIDSCEGIYCAFAGGYFASTVDNARCASNAENNVAGSPPGTGIGFRCCADPR